MDQSLKEKKTIVQFFSSNYRLSDSKHTETHALFAEFHFKSGACILYQVDSQAALDTCNFTGGVPIFDLNSSSPVNV